MYLGQAIQKSSSLIGINNTIKQYVNTYENKELLVHLLESELEKIELCLKQRNIEGARSQIDIILYKKENIPEELECRLIFLKGNIESELGNYSSVNSIIESLSKKEKGKGYSLELKYTSSIKLYNVELMKECIDEFISNGEDEITILKRQIRFYFNNKNFNEIVGKVNYIEENQIEDKEIFHTIAVSYLNIGDNGMAISYCDRSMEFGESNLTTYVKILAEISPILQRKGILINISEVERDFLKQKEIILKELINELPEEIIQEALTIILNIYLIIDLDEGIRFYDTNQEELKDSISSKFLNANIYELSGKYEDANEQYLEIIDQQWSEEVMIHIMFCMRATDNYSSYIRIFEKYENIIQDEEFLLMEFYLESLENIGYLEKANEKLDNIKNKGLDSIRFTIYLTNLEENPKQKLIILKRAEDMLNEFNQYDRILIKDVYLQMEMYEEAINIMRPLFKYKEILGGLIQQIIKNQKTEFYLEMIGEIEKHNDIRLLEYKKLILCEINELLEAKEVAEIIYELESNRENLIELIQLKININDNIGLELLIKKLFPLVKPEEYMIIAYSYMVLGNITKYKAYSYEAIFLLKGFFNKNILENYVRGSLRLIIEGRTENRELEIIKEDCAIILSSESKQINICLNSELKYQTNEEVFGSIHIRKDNPLWLELMSQEVEDIINFNGEEFKIVSILDKNIITFRYCLKELELNKVDVGFMRFTISEMEEKMKEITIGDKESAEKILDMYNFQYNNVGIPFSKLFFGEDINKSIEIFNYILASEENSYYIGTSETNLNNDICILSFQTLLILEHYDILDIVTKDSKKYYVSNMLKSKLVETFLDIKKKKKGLYLHYDPEIGLRKEERDYKIILNKLKNIIDLINKVECLQFDYRVRSNLINLGREWINEFDIETIYLAKELGGLLIIDDLFIRKLINSDETTKDINHTNIINILNILYEKDTIRYYNVVEKMIKNDVKYVMNKEHFKRLILEYKNYGYNIDYFQGIVNVIKNDEYYREVILEACREIISSREHKYIVGELLLVIELLKLV